MNMKDTFPFTLSSVQVECTHCQHQLEGAARFGLDIVRCSNCQKFTQVESRAIATKIVPKRTIEEV